MTTKFETLRSKLDWNHGDGYCKQITVRYWSADWSRGKYYVVTGITQSDSEVDLGTFETYRSDYAWLADMLGEHHEETHSTMMLAVNEKGMSLVEFAIWLGIVALGVKLLFSLFSFVNVNSTNEKVFPE